MPEKQSEKRLEVERRMARLVKVAMAAMADRRVVLRHVLKVQTFGLVWRKTTVELAVVPCKGGERSVCMCSVLCAERVDSRGDDVVIPLDASKEQHAHVRLVTPTRAEALTYAFVVRYEPNAVILRLRAPNAQLYDLWTSAIATAMHTGHEHSIDMTGLCPRCLVGHGDEVGDPAATNISTADSSKEKIQSHGFDHTATAAPSSMDRRPTTLSADGSSLCISTPVAEPASVKASTLGHQLHLALLRQDFAETWVMEARKNLILRVNAQALGVATWSAAGMLSAFRLRAVRTFQLPVEAFPSQDASELKQPLDALTMVTMTLGRKVYAIVDLSSECESLAHLSSSARACHHCTPQFLVFSPTGSGRKYRVAALDWLRIVSSEILKASRSPVVLHVTDRSTCSLVRFSELLFRS